MKAKIFKCILPSIMIGTACFGVFAKSNEIKTKDIKKSQQKMSVRNNGNMFQISIHDSKFNTKPVIENSTDGVFNVTLQSNPSTGFQWFIEKYDKNIINLINYSYIPPQDTKLIGAPGTAKWTFKVNKYAVKAPTVTHIKLMHKRAFEKTRDNDSKEVITVYIQPN